MKNYINLAAILVFLLLQNIDCAEVDYSSFGSIEGVIEWETKNIADISPNDYIALADAHISRGESFLLCDRYESAFADLVKGYEYASIYCEEKAIPLAIRSLFDLTIAYGNADRIEEAYATVNTIKDLLACPCVQDGITLIDQPILGPNEIAIDVCKDRAQGIATSMRGLMVKAKPEVQFVLNILVSDLESRAIKCCERGGIWKACLQPIVNKWYQWNQKWKLFSIPPDPAWDDD